MTTTGKKLFAALAAVGVLVLSACASTERPTAQPSWTPASPSPSPTPVAVPSATPAPPGPRPISYPAADVKDFAQVCEDDVYFPQSPKRSSRAPHPVVVLAGAVGSRYQRTDYADSVGTSKSVQQIWAPKSTKNVQMVACLDYESPGSQIRTCKYGEPINMDVALMRATYRLRVYEVATGRKLLDKTIAGDDPECPIFLAGYGIRYADPTDKKLVAALRDLVTK